MIESAVEALLAYGRDEGLIGIQDVVSVRNRVLEVLQLDTYDLAAPVSADHEQDVDALLAPLLDDAVQRGVISPDTPVQRDLLDTAVMGCFVPPTSDVRARFRADYHSDPRLATDRLHALAVASNYVRSGRTRRNPTWQQATPYGVMDFTINLSKPEKDPRDIAAAASGPSGDYPACLLCKENEGYAGRVDHPARQNLRLVDLELAGEPWYLQFSPYEYYPQHCIVLSDEHRPMRIDDGTFARLAQFTADFPHYFLGSNADLPIVGGSILNHDHFQGGCFDFALGRADVAWRSSVKGVDLAVMHWPLAVLRVSGPDTEVLAFCGRVLAAWQEYCDPELGIVAVSDGEPHNTIAPIARRIEGQLTIDLVLRNNRTSSEHPDGVFHPHSEIHAVKRENIGLIEVQGLAVLPGRLSEEIEAVAQAWVQGGDLPGSLKAHEPMLERLRAAGVARDDVQARAATAEVVGDYFVRGLEHCGVFGPDPQPGWQRFLEAVGAGG